MRRIVGRVGYAVVAVLLIGWELQEGHVYQSENCNLKTAEPSESVLMSPLYSRVLKFAKLKDSQQVSMVAIESGLDQIQANVCPARAFTADLLQAIAVQQPAVIAIDKFYGKGSCATDDPDTAKLLATIASLKVPMVVGASTHTSEQNNTSSCLVMTQQLFSPVPGGNGSTSQAGSAMVHAGLTRLNENPLKIPLVWQVFAKDGDKQVAKDSSGESFALVTTQLMNSALTQTKKFQKLMNSPQQPYADVADPLEKQTSTNLLCTAANPDAVKRWGLNCAGAKPLDVKGKVVVIGAESSADSYSVTGHEMYGFDLQAHYVAALLGGAYLRDIPAAWLLLPLALYYCLAELLLPYMQIHKHPVRPLWHVKHAIVWEIGLFCVTMLIGFFVPLLFHRFPPVAIMLVMMAIFVPRMLIESWALLNEGLEEKEAEKELSS
ncbi:MAG TPA: CHASE2 domain-containing protein [Bryocella sp.]|nr:CHASE2 domain-containing protein [Bryocella sp.]